MLFQHFHTLQISVSWAESHKNTFTSCQAHSIFRINAEFLSSLFHWWVGCICMCILKMRAHTHTHIQLDTFTHSHSHEWHFRLSMRGVTSSSPFWVWLPLVWWARECSKLTSAPWLHWELSDITAGEPELSTVGRKVNKREWCHFCTALTGTCLF